jgi:hypothetical protein
MFQVGEKVMIVCYSNVGYLRGGHNHESEHALKENFGEIFEYDTYHDCESFMATIEKVGKYDMYLIKDLRNDKKYIIEDRYNEIHKT